MAIRITRTSSPKPQPDVKKLGFGKFFSDHMATCECVDGKWAEPQLVPFGPLSIDPAAGALHYGQAMFEGLKAFRGEDGKVRLFRADANAKRMAKGAPRLCMQAPDPAKAVEIFHALVALDRDWVPSALGTSLYLRPNLIATEGYLGVRPSTRYLFYVIASPVGAYYSNASGLEPVRIKVELKLTRAAPGGIGAAKAAANYATSLYSAAEAKKEGYSQVLWMDAKEHAFVEEVGTMNLFAVIGDELVTPPLSDSILAGVTRDSLMTLARDKGIKVVERPITRSELEAGTAKEVFGSGTAAVVSPVGELNFEGKKVMINGGQPGPIAKALYDELTGIQRGSKPDTHGWLKLVE
ncbi:MAG: branched-chain amino acid aminotransferase [Myxococcaceae bacterium]|nr:branched-chain amino acid aminotransferase [Myxococcaceae bacterium]